MAVPFIDIARTVREISAEVERDWAEVLGRCEFVGGPRVATLERELCRVLQVPQAVSCANGTDALVVALQAAGVVRGSRVALPNLTFWATYEAVAQLGATPVLVDIDPDDCQMSFDDFVRAHDEHRFGAAILVHLFGWASARLDDFRRLCAERGIELIEDGAQSFGVTHRGVPLTAGAATSTLSFYPAKVIGGAMDGGAILFQSRERSDLARSLCNHGRAEHYSYARVGWNSRMGGAQAAFLLRMLARLDIILASRRAGAAYYRARLAEAGPRVRCFGPPPDVAENGYLAVMTLHGCDPVRVGERLAAAGIGSARTYPQTMDQQPPAADALRTGDLRHSRAFCASVFNLPLFAGITEAECEESVRALLGALES